MWKEGFNELCVHTSFCFDYDELPHLSFSSWTTSQFTPDHYYNKSQHRQMDGWVGNSAEKNSRPRLLHYQARTSWHCEWSLPSTLLYFSLCWNELRLMIKTKSQWWSRWSITSVYQFFLTRCTALSWTPVSSPATSHRELQFRFVQKRLEVSPILWNSIIYVFFKGACLSSSPALLPRKVLEVVPVRALWLTRPPKFQEILSLVSIDCW